MYRSQRDRRRCVERRTYEDPNYKGPERRIGMERRSGKDRRRFVQLEVAR